MYIFIYLFILYMTAIQFVWTVHHTVDHIHCRILAIH